MKIKAIKLKNFRSYASEITVDFEKLTVFVGKNDIGKSTVLEALDIFFNSGSGAIKMDKDDVNKYLSANRDNEIVISVVFEDLPEKVIIDSSNETDLSSEYLLNANNQLEVIKKYPNGGKEKVFIRANHPSGDNIDGLLQKKNAELKKIIKDNNILCDNQTVNAIMRTSIWNHFDAQENLTEIELDVTRGDTKSIWESLAKYLPIYSLFQSDRKNSDGDSEVQDPLKLAVKQILSDETIVQKLDEVAKQVSEKLTDVSEKTLEKIQEMNSEIANNLKPSIPAVNSLKWTDVFKSVSIVGDEDIPINKRGSGVKRLILLSFFRAEAERRISENKQSVIYAIEEPETSQHTDHQKKLITAFKSLSDAENTQVILTSHSSTIVKELAFENLRLIKSEDDSKTIVKVEPSRLPFPSLNEVNYTAFLDVTEEYHNELYGYIEERGELPNFKQGKSTMLYVRQCPRRGQVNEQKILTEYIRHQIHHPENGNNQRFTAVQLQNSIDLMRVFIAQLNSIHV